MPDQLFGSREGRAIATALAVLVAVGISGYAGIQFYRSWTDREERIAAASEELGRVASLIATENALSKTVAGLEHSGGVQRRLLTARTPALAASELQRVLRLEAERSQVSIDRMEFSSSDQPGDNGPLAIPVTISAVGDIYGITDFLAMLRNESPVVEVAEMSLNSNTALKAGLMQFSATVRAPVLIR